MKRFTDTEKWQKQWFGDLSMQNKLLWLYCCDCCNAAGIADFNPRFFTFVVGFKVDRNVLEKAFGERIFWIDDGKFFIPSFIEFQYGELSDECRPHKPIMAELRKYGLLSCEKGKYEVCIKEYRKGIDTLSIGYPKGNDTLSGNFEKGLIGYSKGINTLEDKDKEQDKDKNKKQQTFNDNHIADNADAGTFRAEGKTELQVFAAWFVKTVLPLTYENCDKADTAAWYKKHGKTLSELMRKSKGDTDLLKAVTAVSMRDMAAFSAGKDVPIPTSLEIILRHWDKYLPLAVAEKKKRLAQEAAERRLREKKAEEESEAARQEREYWDSLSPEDKKRVLDSIRRGETPESAGPEYERNT